MFDIAALAVLLICWLAWFYRFLARSKEQGDQQPSVTDPRARWGIALQAVGFFLAWFRSSHSNPAAMQVAAMILAPLSAWLVWDAVKHSRKATADPSELAVFAFTSCRHSRRASRYRRCGIEDANFAYY